MAIRYPMIITNTTLGIVLRFIPNPNSIKFESKKIFSQTQTLEGFVFEHWGEAPGVLRVQGQTIGLYTQSGEVAAEAFLFALRQLYRVDKKRVASLSALVKPGAGKLYSKIKSKSATVEDFTQLSSSFLYYRTDAYSGFFSSFQFEQRGDAPNIYSYQFDYVVTSTAQNFAADWLFTPSTAALPSLTRSLAGSALITGAGELANALVDPSQAG